MKIASKVGVLIVGIGALSWLFLEAVAKPQNHRETLPFAGQNGVLKWPLDALDVGQSRPTSLELASFRGSDIHHTLTFADCALLNDLPIACFGVGGFHVCIRCTVELIPVYSNVPNTPNRVKRVYGEGNYPCGNKAVYLCTLVNGNWVCNRQFLIRESTAKCSVETDYVLTKQPDGP